MVPHRVGHLGGERAIAKVPQHRNGVGVVGIEAAVRRDQVDRPVGVDIRRRDADRSVSRRVGHLGRKRPIAQVPQDRNGVGGPVRRDQVDRPVGVDIRRRDAARIVSHHA